MKSLSLVFAAFVALAAAGSASAGLAAAALAKPDTGWQVTAAEPGGRVLPVSGGEIYSGSRQP